MGLVVNTNVQSLFAQRALRRNTSDLQRSMEALSTGFRINRAADDAAGLSISEKMTSNIKALGKASQNALDGISLIQTAEGSLAIIQDNLQRIRELVVQATNGTNGISELNAVQREINERITTIEDIAKSTKFNGQSLLFGGTDKVLQTGAEDGQTTTIQLVPTGANTGLDIDIDAVSANGQLSEGAAFALSALKVTTNNAASVGNQAVPGTGTVAATANPLAGLDFMIDNVSRMRSGLGAVQNGLESKIEFLQVAKENLSSARSRIKDIDVASESSELIKNQILQQSASAMLTQANSSPEIALDLLP